MNTPLIDFLEQVRLAIANQTFVKLTISQPRSKHNDLKKFSFQFVKIKDEAQIKCVYTHQTKDITKNYSFEESIKIVEQYLGTDFKNGVLFTTEKDFNLLYNKKMEGRLMTHPASFATPISMAHNKLKKKFITTHENQYLKALGVLDEKWQVKKTKEDKFKQINKYIETFDGIFKNSNLKDQDSISVVDMGSGKGYLTFALYDYLSHTLKKKVKMTGVELRSDLVELCNTIAQNNGFEGLSFTEGSIQNFKKNHTDVVIALHACDTATDDAIFNGICSKASIIITAPCCHKQVRNALHVENELKSITQFGILEERQAEILTDAIRALALESQGYKSQVFEFIADAHTHKNVMVVGTKKRKSSDSKKYLDKIEALKSKFGLESQYLEQKLKSY